MKITVHRPEQIGGYDFTQPDTIIPSHSENPGRFEELGLDSTIRRLKSKECLEI